MMRSSKARIILFFLLVSLALFLLDRALRLDWITYPLRNLMAPVQTISENTLNTLLAPLQTISFIRSGERRIKYLEQRNLELSAQISEVKSLREENTDLKKQLGAIVSKSHLLEPAKVLGNERFLEIKMNNPSNIKISQSVVYLNNYIGRIIKTGRGIAYVQLITDPDSKVPGKTENRATGLVIGQFFSDLLFDKVSKSDSLNVSDLVLTSGSGEITVPDLVLGKVSKIVPSSDDLFQKAILLSEIKINELSEVYVIVDQ